MAASLPPLRMDMSCALGRRIELHGAASPQPKLAKDSIEWAVSSGPRFEDNLPHEGSLLRTAHFKLIFSLFSG
jgi:hypothetical protein